MKTPVRTQLLLLFSIFTLFSCLVQGQTIFQLNPLSTFGSHGDGTLRPGDAPWLDTIFNQRGVGFDPVLGNLVLVDTHSGSGGSADVRGNIYVLNSTNGNNLDDGLGGNLVLNTNGINGGSYADVTVGIADDGAVYVCNQIVNSGTLPFIIYRWDSTTSTLPPLIVFSNNITPAQRYGSDMGVRGAGTNTQIIIGSLPNGSTGTNVVIFTTADGTNFSANVLGSDTSNPNFNDGIAFGPGNTFWAKRIGAPLRWMAFDLTTNIATTIRSFTSTTFPDNDNLGPIAVDTNRNLLAAIEIASGIPAGGTDRVRLYDISDISNSPPALLDARLYPVSADNATAAPGYLDFGGANLYAMNVNNGMMAFNVALSPIPAPTITTQPPDTNKVVVGRTINLTVAAFPSVHYQWQSNGVDILDATNGTLTLANVQTSFAGIYNCVVTNTGGFTNASTRLEVVSSASFYHLNLTWSAAPNSRPWLQGITPGTPNQRSIGFYAPSNHLYVVARSSSTTSNYTFWVVDAGTGDALYTLNTNGITLGVGNGGIGLSSIAVADDGAIYACNIAPAAGGFINGVFDATRQFRIYRWANANSNTVPVEIFTGDPAIAAGMAGPTFTNRWGDSLAVRGSGTNTLLVLDNNNSNARFITFLYPTDSTMTSWAVAGVHQLSTGSSIGRSLNYGVGNTLWQKRNATALIQSPFDLVSPIDPAPELVRSTAFTNALSGAVIDNARHLLAGVSIYPTAITGPDTVDLYEISDLNSPLLLAQYNFPANFGTNHNVATPNAINQIIQSGDKIFALEGGNGVMAFNVASGPPTAPKFLTPPQDIRVIQGGTGSFIVSVDQQAVFQWQFNQADIPGATNASYIILNAQLTNSGEYRVIATNLFGKSTSDVAVATIYLPQDEYSLAPLWSAPIGSQPYISGLGGGTPNTRTMAYNALSNLLYLVSRSSPGTSNYVIYALNASDGSIVSTLNTNGIYNGGAVGEGGIGLGGIGVADDGAIYACNIALDSCGCGPNAGGTPADSMFRIYRWADGNSNTLPVQVFVGDPAGQTGPVRWGDTMAVRGSGTNTEILLDSLTGLGAVLKPTDEFMTNLSTAYFTTSPQSTTIGRSLQYGPTNTIWQKRVGTALRASSYDLVNHTSTQLASYANFGSTLGPVFQDAFHSLMAGINFNGTTNTGDSVDLYEMSVPTEPLLIAQYRFPTNQQPNGNFIGQVLFAGNRVWALDCNNGLMAFTITGPELDITQSGGNVMVSWTTNLTGLLLQSTPTLAPPAWGPVTNMIITVGDRYTITDDAAAGPKFYRLVR